MFFFEKMMRFMSGRYGKDELFFVLTGMAALLAFCNLFFRNIYLQAVVYALIAVALLRFFSRNFEQRRKENAAFRRCFSFFRQERELRRKRKNDPFHVYKKCPVCKAILRLPRRPGRHETVCPKCSKRFSVRVRRERRKITVEVPGKF